MNKINDIDRNIKNLAATSKCSNVVEGIGKKVETCISSKLDAIDRKLESLMLNKMSQSIEMKINSIDKQLEKICDLLNCDREKESNDAERNENIYQEDRKRLKERLIAAVEHKDTAGDINNNASWMEKIFGIRQADGRLGKERSRYRHGSPL